MSWQTFKQNVLQYANNPESIQDIDTIARVLATEYDAAVKRGGTTVDRIAVKQGNVEGMIRLFKSALEKGLSSKEPYDLVGELGDGVKAYWAGVGSTGAILNNYPTPLIPAPGTTSNVSVTSAVVTNVGQWTPPVIAVPTLSEPTAQELYAQLDFEKAGIDTNDPEVQQIIEPFDEEKFDEKVAQSVEVDDDVEQIYPETYSDDNVYEDYEIATGQNNEDVVDEIYQALDDQGIIDTEAKIDVKSGFTTLKELIKVGDAWARRLGKHADLKYSNWIGSYNKAVHGKCAAGVKSLACAMLGFSKLGSQSGNANDFSFRSGKSGSFALSDGGKKYYNAKQQVNIPMVERTNKKGNTLKVPNWNASYIGDSKQWRIGDIIAFDYTASSGKPYGHIQIWTGWAWVSDHVQRGISALTYADPNTVALWRYNDNGAAKIAEYSSKANPKNI
jgi:hypothetical protein